MIRRRSRIGAKPARSDSASSCPTLAFPKGRTRREEKDQQHLAEVARIAEVRNAVWKRSDRCELCGETEADAIRLNRAGKIGHEMHECWPRAKTRRMRPEWRFDTAWCIRVCPQCHRACTANRAVVAFFVLHLGANAGRFCIAAVTPGQVPAGWYTAEDVWLRVTQPESSGRT